MGKFESGHWIIGLSLYFFMFFIVVNAAISLLDYYNVENNLRFDDTGFGSEGQIYDGNTSVSPDDSYSFDTFLDSISIITGVGAGNVEIGVPAEYKYIFSFIFFWLPFLALSWAIYMALPWVH